MPLSVVAVLVGAESEHREAVRLAVGAGDRAARRERRRHRGEVAQLVRRNGRRVMRRSVPLMSGAVSSSRAAFWRSALHLHGVELRRHALELRVGDENFLIARSLDLEPLGREAERGDVDEVVAVVAGERDGVATVLVRCAWRETLPESDVTVTRARSIGRLSGPVMRPRITSVCA